MSYLTVSDIYIDDVIESGGGGAFDDLESAPVPDKYVLEVRHASIENQTNAYTRLLIGIKKGRKFIQHEAEEVLVADQIYWTRSRIHVPEGYTFCARLYGCTAADKLVMTIDGMLYKVGD
jgi:hypothetical protein